MNIQKLYVFPKKSSKVSAKFTNSVVYAYNGKDFIKIKITSKMVGKPWWKALDSVKLH